MAFCWTEEKEPDYRHGINWCEFIKDLDIGIEESAAEDDKRKEMQNALIH